VQIKYPEGSEEAGMTVRHHVELTFGALKRWFIVQCCDAVIVGLLWLAALWYLQIPLAEFWAFLGGVLQFVPHFGPVLALLGPTVALLISRAEWEQYVGLLIAYAAIAVVDGLVLQPYLMRRHNRVPVWASILAPLVLGYMIPFWGVFLAPPLLAVIYAHVRRQQTRQEMARPERAIVLPPEQPAKPRATRTAPVIDSKPEAGSGEASLGDRADPGGEPRNG
jgi:predicted PurR-regulated permease PerM